MSSTEREWHTLTLGAFALIALVIAVATRLDPHELPSSGNQEALYAQDDHRGGCPECRGSE